MRTAKFKITKDEIIVSPNEHSNTPTREFVSLVRCPGCSVERYVKSNYIHKQIKNGKWTGRCVSCQAKHRNSEWAKTYHPSYKGHKKITKDGYVSLSLKSFKDTEYYDIASSVSYNNGKIKRVLEHRFVMAKKLNRPLLSTEIVHHKNGKKDDNRIDNLELLTIKSHHKGHGDFYYEEWQKALSEIERLKETMNQQENL